MGFLSLQAILPPGTVFPFAGSTAPDGYLVCNGAAVSRDTYAALFAAIGVSYGNGNGSTTFNVPDYRYTFLRGYGAQITATGANGVVPSGNQLTFSSHGINRTGLKVKLSSGTLSGLTTSVAVYAIVIDANTLAFASTYASAVAVSPTRIALSGTTVTPIITQWEDPNITNRGVSNIGGNSGANVGSRQEDEYLSHRHGTSVMNYSGIGFGQCQTGTGRGGGVTVVSDPGGGIPTGAANVTDYIGGGTLTASTQAATETRGRNLTVNYIIKT
jgi:microcystin-dependent protein